MMARQIPEDHNYRTECPVSVKGKITQLENAAMEYAFIGTKDPLDHDAIVEYAQSSRYDLEQTVMTEIKKATKALQVELNQATQALEAMRRDRDDWKDFCKGIARNIDNAMKEPT